MFSFWFILLFLLYFFYMSHFSSIKSWVILLITIIFLSILSFLRIEVLKTNKTLFLKVSIIIIFSKLFSVLIKFLPMKLQQDVLFWDYVYFFNEVVLIPLIIIILISFIYRKRILIPFGLASAYIGFFLIVGCEIVVCQQVQIYGLIVRKKGFIYLPCMFQLLVVLFAEITIVFFRKLKEKKHNNDN